MNATNMTEAQTASFYNITNPASFGYALMMVNNETHNKYKCESAPNEGQMSYYPGNCSSDFLAASQWGQSKVTMDPPYADAFYFPVFEL